MKIFIYNISGTNVSASTEFGDIKGKWCSNSIPTQKEYIVEIDCRDLLSTQNFYIAKQEVPFLKIKGEHVQICGYCESFEDGVLFLRLGKYLIMLECESGLAMSSFIGSYLCVTLSSIELYDTGIL